MPFVVTIKNHHIIRSSVIVKKFCGGTRTRTFIGFSRRVALPTPLSHLTTVPPIKTTLKLVFCGGLGNRNLSGISRPRQFSKLDASPDAEPSVIELNQEVREVGIEPKILKEDAPIIANHLTSLRVLRSHTAYGPRFTVWAD